MLGSNATVYLSSTWLHYYIVTVGANTFSAEDAAHAGYLFRRGGGLSDAAAAIPVSISVSRRLIPHVSMWSAFASFCFLLFSAKGTARTQIKNSAAVYSATLNHIVQNGDSIQNPHLFFRCYPWV